MLQVRQKIVFLKMLGNIKHLFSFRLNEKNIFFSQPIIFFYWFMKCFGLCLFLVVQEVGKQNVRNGQKVNFLSVPNANENVKKLHEI